MGFARGGGGGWWWREGGRELKKGFSGWRRFGDVQRWPYVYDTVALATLYDESLDLDVRELYVDVDCDFSAEYGKGLVWEEDPYPALGVVGRGGTAEIR